MKRSFRIFGQALRAIGRNKGRSFLTMLGIIIGIASVISLVAVGNGASNNVTGRISSLGTNILTIRSGAAITSASSGGVLSSGLGGAAPRMEIRTEGGPGGQRQQATLTADDLKALKDNAGTYKLSDVAGFTSGNSELTLKEKDSEGKDQTARMSVSGTEKSYFDIQSLSFSKGGAFSDTDVSGSNKVAVLGSQTATELFGTDDPIGQTIKLEDDTYTVVGVLNNKEESGFNNPNRQIYIPYTSAQATYDVTNFSAIYAKTPNQNDVLPAKDAIQKKLLELHDKNEQTADFSISTPQDLLNTIKQSTSVFTTLLAGIASISLVVGGIGIMNIMLVAVSERTREIGLRKALGARTRDILQQFVFESVLLCLAGGLIGIAIGALTAANLSKVLTGIVPVVTLDSVLLAVGVSTIVGLVFGIYPAAKAAKLNPIDALRYE